MEPLRETAARIDRLASDVTGAVSRLAGADPGYRAFGAEGPGALAALGQSLHEQWVVALAAGEREAAAHAARLADLGDGLRRAADGYRATEETVARRHGTDHPLGGE